MSELFVKIIFILIPGIIATVICDKIASHSKWTSFKFGLYSFLLGVFSYLVVQIILNLFDVLESYGGIPLVFRELGIWKSAFNNENQFNQWEVVYASLASVPLAFAASALINYKVFNRFARFIKITRKYGDENLYSYYLNLNEVSWIYVRDIKNNLTYQGTVWMVSECDNVQEIVLLNVSVYKYENSTHLYDVPSIYISRPAGDLVIEAIPPSQLEKADAG